LVGFFGLSGTSAVVEGQAEVIPGLGVRCKDGSGGFQFFDGLGVLALLDQLLAAQQVAGAGRSTASAYCQEGEKEKYWKTGVLEYWSIAVLK
jgi:hypothetical protein